MVGKLSRAGYVVLTIAALILVACGGGSGGGGGATATNHQVTLTWNANHEKGVNSAGGGYKVAISGVSNPVDVPFNAASGITPTSTVVTLSTGTYTATVSAYAALDANGGAAGSTSASSSSISIIVP